MALSSACTHGFAVALLVLPALAQAPALWSLQPPVRPPVPPVRQADWPCSDLDRFVLARLEQAGLAPSPEADRATLLRRLTFDLTGLPPTPDELAAFLADGTPDAYGRTVDRLLATTAHGERMAQLWLDLARYTDTNGFDFDTDRQMWAWRDWVVRAFAEDMPYDRFTLEQIAGDLLPDATLSQRIATGFHRNHAVALQIDGQPGEFHHQYVADRTATFATTWLGLSVGCAECHDHKFDPITQRDYYAMYAFWNRMPEKGLERNVGNAAPFLQVPTAEQGAALLELQAKLDDLERQLQAGLRACDAGFAAFCGGLAAATVPAAELLWLEPLDGERPGQTELGGIGKGVWAPGLRGGAVQLDGHDACVRVHRPVELRADDAFTVSAWIRLLDNGRSQGGAIVGKVDEAAKGRGWQFTVEGRRLGAALIGGDKDSLRVAARDPLEFGVWHHVAFTYDGSRQVAGLQLFVDGLAAAAAKPPAPAAKRAAEPLVGEIDNDGALRIGSLDGRPFAGDIDELRVHGRALTAAELAALADADLGAGADAPTAERFALLQRLYALRGEPALAAIAAERAAVRARHRELSEAVPVVSVMAEMTMPRPTFLLVRGDYQRPGERVEPAIPAVFGALPADAPRNRLGLARWLVGKDHPLVARVHCNRLWRAFFGNGLVETLDDFGARGERPSHPELLDWLARELIDSGFRHRRFVKLLVTSATYRQSSVLPAALREIDPDNRLLARASRWRLDAEMLRDQSLAVAGLLDTRAFGPAVMPWQPEDLWPAPSPVGERHRRALYIAQKRQVPFVTMRLFDAPGREICVARRDRTTTPLQALALFNDRNFAEAARALAQRLLGEAGDDASRLQRGFLLCVQRAPAAAELAVLQDLLATQRGLFAADPQLAAAAATVGDAAPAATRPCELAAWAAVAAVLLNLDETLVRS